MSMRTAPLLCALAVAALSACGQDESAAKADAREPSAPSKASVLAPSPFPPLLTLQTWPAETPFFPKGVTRAGTIIVSSPDTRGNYRAYGVDGSKGYIVFQLELTARDLNYFNYMLSAQQINAATILQSSDPTASYTNGIFGYIAPVGPPPPPNDGAYANTLITLAQTNLNNQSNALQPATAPLR